MHLYRIAQEGLNNIMRHSGADRARFTLERDVKCIRLGLWDNGRGFDVKEKGQRHGLGLTSMMERARMIGGKADIQTAPGAGTRITVELPLE
jgi:signal transduction histidine kinase